METIYKSNTFLLFYLVVVAVFLFVFLLFLFLFFCCFCFFCHFYFITFQAIYENMLVELPFASFFLCKLLSKQGTNVDIHHLESLDPEMYRYA